MCFLGFDMLTCFFIFEMLIINLMLAAIYSWIKTNPPIISLLDTCNIHAAVHTSIHVAYFSGVTECLVMAGPKN